jgi:hypothetical protein
LGKKGEKKGKKTSFIVHEHFRYIIDKSKNLFLPSTGSTTKYQMTGAILELKATIDVETEVSVWSVEITVTDIGAQIYTTPTVVYVTINVDGVDDNVPVWHVDNSGVYIGCT